MSGVAELLVVQVDMVNSNRVHTKLALTLKFSKFFFAKLLAFHV